MYRPLTFEKQNETCMSTNLQLIDFLVIGFYFIGIIVYGISGRRD
jgi:hypothetical protein